MNLRPYDKRSVGVIIGWFCLILMAMLVSMAARRMEAKTPFISDGSSLQLSDSGNLTDVQTGKVVARAVKGADHDELTVGLLADPTYSGASFSAGIVLPEHVAAATSVSFMSIQGTDGMEALTNDGTVIVQASSILADSHTIAKLTFPAGSLHIPWYRQLWHKAATLPLQTYLILSSVSYLFLLLLRGWVRAKPRQRSFLQNEPPPGMSPLEFAVMLHGELRPIDLAAMMYDLAERGLILVIQQEEETYFVRTSKESELSAVESAILSMLSQDSTKPSSLSAVASHLTEELFSESVSLTYENLYGSLQSRCMFEESLTDIHIRFKTAGIVVQFFAIAVAILTYVWTGFSGLGVLLAAGLIYAAGNTLFGIGYVIVPLSQKGRELADRIYGFIDFLTMEKPVGTGEGGIELFHRYLPYAVVAGKTEQWFGRFYHDSFAVPAWFTAAQDTYYPLDYLAHIDQVSKRFSKLFVKVKDPNVD